MLPQVPLCRVNQAKIISLIGLEVPALRTLAGAPPRGALSAPFFCADHQPGGCKQAQGLKIPPDWRESGRVGTALTEATANFLVNCRMAKPQQMRWSRRGADLLLQCAVLNGKLGSGLGQLFHADANSNSEITFAA